MAWMEAVTILKSGVDTREELIEEVGEVTQGKGMKISFQEYLNEEEMEDFENNMQDDHEFLEGVKGKGLLECRATGARYAVQVKRGQAVKVGIVYLTNIVR